MAEDLNREDEVGDEDASLDDEPDGRPWWRRKRTVWFLALFVMGGVLLYLTFSDQSGIAASYKTHFRIELALGLVLAAFICEYFDSSLGMGYGTTLTPLLIILGFTIADIVPAVMFSQMIGGFAAGAAHHTLGNVSFDRKSHDTHVMLALASCSFVGGSLAVAFTSHVPEQYLRLWVGCLILGIGVFMLATRKRRPAPFSWPRMMGLGLLASFNKGSSGGGYGPLVMGGQILAGVNPSRAVGISVLGEAITCVIYLGISSVAKGLPMWRLALPLCAGALLSVPLAAYTVKLMPPKILRGAIAYVTLFLGALALVKVLFLSK
jgi:uncharacterized membrane protein YfcA